MTSNNKNRCSRGKSRYGKFKNEAANEVGSESEQGYNGDLTSREAGSVGGQMVKKMTKRTKLPQISFPAQKRSMPRHTPFSFFKTISLCVNHTE